jgi:hypothetical protein
MQRWPELREGTELAVQASHGPQASLAEVHFGSQMLGEAKIGTREGECQKAERKQRVRFCEAQAVNGSGRGAEGVLKSSDMHGCAW